MTYHKGLSDFLKTYAPDFCWCSMHDLLIMTEQESKYEDVPEESFRVTLCHLKKQGFFITKKNIYCPAWDGMRSVGNLYLRVK